MKPQNILLAVPTMGTIRIELANFIIDNQWHSVLFSNCVTPHSNARNQLVSNFLKTDAEWLLFVDSDTVPPEDTIVRFMQCAALDYLVMTGVTPVLRKDVPVANVYKTAFDVQEPMDLGDMPEQPFEVAGCGAACLMVHRSVFENLARPWFKSIEFDNGAYCSEDLFFCDRVVTFGEKILAIPDIMCEHYKTVAI